MKTHDVQNELTNGIDVVRIPPPGPDGALRLPAMRLAIPPPPRLCEQGPCVHYHQFTIQLDAERARAAAVLPAGDQHGRLVGPGSEVFHTEVHHYCYPHSGVETILGSLPIIQCNRWTPKTDAQCVDEAERGAAFLESPEGKQYLAEQAAWQSARAAEQAAQDADEAEAKEIIAAMALQVGGEP